MKLEAQVRYQVNRDSLTNYSQGLVAQLVEQRTSNPKVMGSNPT